MSTDPSDPLAPSTEPEVLPSSTPDGPQTIPAPDGPGDPRTDPQTGGHQTGASTELPAEAQPGELGEPLRASNPSSAGPEGLAGDLGISSERTGPAGDEPRGSDITGTGSAGGAVGRTDGGVDTSPTPYDAPDVSGSDVNPMPEGSEDMTGAGNDPAGPETGNIDRTVGEQHPNPIPDEKLRRGAREPRPTRNA